MSSWRSLARGGGCAASVAAAAAITFACATAVRPAVIGSTGAKKESLSDAQVGFLVLTKTEQGRAILMDHFPEEYFEYLADGSVVPTQFSMVRTVAGSESGGCDGLDGHHKACKRACLAAFGACVAGAAGGCALSGPAWPECFALESSAACIPAILICLNHCANLDDRRRERCQGGTGT